METSALASMLQGLSRYPQRLLQGERFASAEDTWTASVLSSWCHQTRPAAV